MNDLAFGVASPVRVENDAARRLAAPLRALAPGHALCIGSVSFLAQEAYRYAGPTLYVWRLANLIYVVPTATAGGVDLLSVLRHTVWRHACDSAWPVAADRAPAVMQRFALDSPLQAALVCALAQRALAAGGGAPAGWWYLDLERGPACAAPPTLPLAVAPARDHSPLRHHALDTIGPAVMALATHPGVGLLGRPTSDLDAPVPSCSATLRLAGVPDIITLGRAANARQAAAVACLEAIERHAGLTAPNGARTWEASFADLDVPKLDPRHCGLHLADSYAAPDFPYVPFHEDLVLDWVYGQELGSGRDIALPASLAYYGASATVPRVRLAYETSNGCAVGTSFEEASLHGLLELVERDAFLMAWYRRTPLPDITRQLSRHPAIHRTLRHLALLTGGSVRILDSTLEAGIPSVICCFTGASLPSQVLSAGASLSHADAARAALAELSGHWLFLRQRFDDPDVRRHARALHEGDAEVVSMEDHGYANALPESRARMAFLLQGGDAAEDPRYAPGFGPPSDSVRASLAWLLERLAGASLRPIAVPQHTAQLRQAGLHCVKVVCPGLSPMTFGHRNRRLASARLDAATQRRAASLPPHPFM